MTVVSDTGPIRYLVLIGADGLLPTLFGSILMPRAVLDELRHPNAPEFVRLWTERLPPWAEARSASSPQRFVGIGPGEDEAIALAIEVDGVLLADDMRALRAARRFGLEGFGTLGVLQRAHALSLLDIEEALVVLGTTNFRHTPELFETVI